MKQVCGKRHTFSCRHVGILPRIKGENNKFVLWQKRGDDGSWICRKCSREGRRQRRRDDPKRFIWYRAKTNAERRDEVFTLALADIPEIPKFCPVLPWIRLRNPVGEGLGPKPYGISIDKIVPKKGYTPGNVRIISYRANQLKSDGTVREFKLVIKDLARIEKKEREKR